MPGCFTSASPAVWPQPVTTLKHAGRQRPRAASSAKRSAESDVCSLGLTMIVLPAASGAAMRAAANISGWLNGMIRATTPYGWRSV